MAHREGITVSPHDWAMIPAGSLIDEQEVITIEGSLPVEEACKILVEKNISSAPVYAPGNRQEYLGMFDYGDVIAYLLLVLLDQVPGHLQQEDASIEITDIIRRAAQGQSVPVSLASDLSQKNPFYSILPETTLLSALEEFACGTHRVSVLNPDGSIKGILSQSTVVQYLFNNQKQFPNLEATLGKTLAQLDLGETDVIGVSSDARVLDALSEMSRHGVSSVAVLSSNNVVMGNISMTDIKHVMKNLRHELLRSTAFQFVSVVRTEQGIDDGQDRLPVFDVRLETTFGFTIAKLLATRSHRVWVTDEMGRAIGVVSLTDITRVFASLAGGKVPHERRASVAQRPL
ncbi:hypothetical protein BCR43DRAFT_563973 [Syncephalastrum racemosum]|uniref:CBS domain-containing protein n=1 Tax=Syncephalastrum racemosum TaxID=13706 RepID=A0A1X2HD68_SYNRA|nr:hypothetical protein BCR43DRAFT_563973 [Syncephalastrum racemosum]